MKKLLLTLLITLLVLTGCSNKPTSSEPTKDVVIGMIGSDSVVWGHVAKEAAKEGINITFKSFTDYTQPNRALNDKDIDLNVFQHHVYLEKEIESHGYKITPIANTAIAPMGIYSKKITSLDEIQKGAQVSIPDDITNGGRALQLLQAEGIIKLNDEKFPTIKDIVDNPLELKFLELSAANIPGTLGDVDFAIINSGIAVDAGLIPTETAIVLENVTTDPNNPYVNLIAARTEEKDNPVFKRIIELYQTDEVRQLIVEDSKGSSFPVW